MGTNAFFRYTEFITRRPFLSVALLLGLTALWGSGTRFTVLDNDIRQFFSHDSDDARFLEEHQTLFGSDETTLLIFLDGRESTPVEMVSMVEAVSGAMERIEGAERIDSVTATSILHSQADELLISPAFGAESRITGTHEERLALFHDAAMGGERLISRDGHLAMVLVRLEDRYRDLKLLGPPVQAVEEAVTALIADSSIRAHYGGVPFVRYGAIASMMNDLGRLFPLTVLLIGLLLYAMFRRKHAVLLPLLAIGLSCLSTVGAVSFLGYKLNPLTIVFPILLLVIAVADGVHFLSRYHEERSAGATYREAVAIAGGRIGAACFLTSFTTTIGFASLMLTEMQILRDFGAVVAIGVVFAFFTVITLLPSGLALSKSPPSRPGELISTRIEQLVRWMLQGRRPLGFALLGVALGVVSLGFAQRAKVDNFLTHALPVDHRYTEGNAQIETLMSGIVPVEFSFVGDEGVFRQPENLRRLESVIDYVKTRGIQNAVGLSSLLRDLNHKLSGRDVLPETPAAVAQLLLLVEDNDDSGLSRIVTDDYAYARVFGTSVDIGSHSFLELKHDLDAFLARTFEGTGIQARVTGVATVASVAFLGLVEQLLFSLLVALVVIMGAIVLVFRSVSMAAAGLLSNVLPLLMGLAWYGIADTYLNPGPAVVFSVALGIAVDDTIHVLARYREELTRHDTHREAIVAAVVHSLGAIAITSVILVAGFLVIGSSSFPQNQQFGVLGAVIIFLALVTDLIFTPACLMLLRPGTPRGRDD